MKSVFKRALRYIRGNVGKVIITFLLLFITLYLLSVAFNVKGSSELLIEASKGTSQQDIFIYYDYEQINFDDESEVFQDLSMNDKKAQELVDAGYLSDYDVQYNIYSTFDYYVDTYSPAFNLLASDNYQDISYYQLTDDSYQFSDAQNNNSENVAIIPQYFIDNGEYSIGDTFTFSIDFDGSGYDTDSIEIPEYEFTIVGTYDFIETPELKNDIEQFGGEEEFYNYSQTYIPASSAKILIDNISEIESQATIDDSEFYSVDGESMFYYTYISYYADPDVDVDYIEQGVNEIMGENYIVESSSETELYSYGIVRNMYEMSNVIIAIVSIASILILGLLILFFTRSRSKEFGILIALGESRVNIFWQIFIEFLLIALVALVITIPLGYFTVNAISSFSLDSLIYPGIDMGYEPESLSFSIKSNLLFVLFSIIIIAICTFFSAIYLFRLKPKKILQSN